MSIPPYGSPVPPGLQGLPAHHPLVRTYLDEVPPRRDSGAPGSLPGAALDPDPSKVTLEELIVWGLIH